MTTIGINFSGGHDSSAAVAVDGRVVFAIAEERITRQKQDAAFPINAIRACLDRANVADFGAIGVGSVGNHAGIWSGRNDLHNCPRNCRRQPDARQTQATHQMTRASVIVRVEPRHFVRTATRAFTLPLCSAI